MIIIGTEKEINEKIKSLSNEKLLKNEYGKPYYENINIRFNKYFNYSFIYNRYFHII